MLYFEAIYTFLLSKYCMTCFSKYNKNEHLKSTYVCSKGFTCLLSYPLTLLVVASLFIYTSFCFFQGSPWWQERPAYGIITALRNSFSIHGEITHFKDQQDQLNIWNYTNIFNLFCGSLFLLYSTVIASNILLVDEIMRAGMSSLKG